MRPVAAGSVCTPEFVAHPAANTVQTLNTIAEPSFLMIGYMYRPYTANTFSGRFTYYW